MTPPEPAPGALPGEESIEPPPVEAPIARGKEKKAASKRSTFARIAAAIGWLMFVIVLGGLAAAAYESDAVMEAYPGSKPVFEALGFEVPKPGDGLRLSNVTTVRVSLDGAPALVIEGKITNTTTSRRPVPALRGSLRDASDKEVHGWVFSAPADKLSAGDSIAFRTEVKQPSGQATGLSIAFVQAQH
jgi:hypothetical protein